MPKTKLAILGLGSRSTLFFISELNRLFNHAKGGYSTCPFVMLNTDFNAINSLLPNTSHQLDVIIKAYLSKIEKLDVEHLLIPNITLHETIDRLKINNKVLHPVHLTQQKIKENNWKKIVLFGSLHSMTSTYISSHFKLNNIEVLRPSQEDMLVLDDIRKRVYSETETEDLIKNYHALIEKYCTNDPVILACTELSIFKPQKFENLLDMASVQISEAIKINI